MKIIHELNQLDFGGVERVIRNLIKFDDKNQHSIAAYKGGNYREELEKVGAKIYVATDEEIELEADIIHVHSGGEKSQAAYQLYDRFALIETIHSPIRSPMPASMFYKRVGVSNAVTVRNNNCETIYNGLDFDDLEPKGDSEKISRDLGINENDVVIGRLGRIGTDKGVEDFLLTCFYLQQRGHTFKTLIVGGEARNAPGYAGKMRLMAESLPVRDVIWVDETDDPGSYMSMMDIFLYPSPTEGFGLVFMEAMYCGCVLVTYKTDVTYELMAGYARLAEQSIMGLVNETEKLLLNNELMTAYSGMTHDWVKSEFSAQRMAEGYQELYERCHRHTHGAHQPQEEHGVPA